MMEDNGESTDMKADAEAIYIVDDDPAVRDALSVLFNMEGYVVETFSDGDTFVNSARSPFRPASCWMCTCRAGPASRS